MRKDADVKDRDEGIASAIRGSIFDRCALQLADPDEIVKVAEKRAMQ